MPGAGGGGKSCVLVYLAGRLDGVGRQVRCRRQRVNFLSAHVCSTLRRHSKGEASDGRRDQLRRRGMLIRAPRRAVPGPLLRASPRVTITVWTMERHTRLGEVVVGYCCVAALVVVVGCARAPAPACGSDGTPRSARLLDDPRL